MAAIRELTCLRIHMCLTRALMGELCTTTVQIFKQAALRNLLARQVLCVVKEWQRRPRRVLPD